jgi:hypothetical protein
MGRSLTVLALLNGVFPEHDDKRRRDIGRRYLGLMAVPTAVFRARAEDIYSMEHLPLEEDGMRYFLPEECGRVPSIETVHPFLTGYIRSWLWQMSSRPSLSALLSGSVPRPPQSLRDLIRLGEGSNDSSFDRLGRLRAVICPCPRSDAFFSDCEDDLLESILQTSISKNRVVLVVFWLIAAFRCGFKEELLAVVFTRLELVWKLCIILQGSSLVATTDVNDVPVERMYARDDELEELWMKVCQSIHKARESYGADGEERGSCRQARSLTLSNFVEGGFSRDFSQRVKRAALDMN